MTAKGYGNFAFLFDLNKPVYEKLLTAEKNARIDFRASGRRIRGAMEKFIGAVIKDKNLKDAVPLSLELYDQIKMLRTDRMMQDAGYLEPGQSLASKPILPSVGRVDFLQENGERGNLNLYDFIRKVGNACSHEEIVPTNPKINFDNLTMALEGMHKILRNYYGRPELAFDVNLMPIGDFVVTASYVPSDYLRSKCMREFVGHTLDDSGRVGFHALIRMYDRRFSGGIFMLRNQKCFLEACKLCMSGVPEGMTTLREITPARSEASNFYIICYMFNREPQPLTEKLLLTMNMKQRLEICARLARCLDNLHHSEVPIYHRMLSYESVYLSKFRDKWIPYVVKFDYAKIVTEQPVETVIVPTEKAREILLRQGKEKYMAPEWYDIEKDRTKADWKKVDVYSLGVLMCDVLRGSFGVDIADFDELEEAGVPDTVLETLDEMLAQSPAKRCTMDWVREVFDYEIR